MDNPPVILANMGGREQEGIMLYSIPESKRRTIAKR
jgi:hypothetical protein